MKTASGDPMLTNSLGSAFSATFQLRGSSEGGIDGLDLDFSDHLDMDDNMFDDIFPEDDHHMKHDESFRDDKLATFEVPTFTNEQPPAGVGSSDRATPAPFTGATPPGVTPLSSVSDHYLQSELIGSASTHTVSTHHSHHSGPPSLGCEPVSMPLPPRRPRRRQTVDSAPAFTQEQIQQLKRPRRRVSTASAPDPDCMSELMEIRTQGLNRGFDEFAYEGDNSGHHIPRVCSENLLFHPSEGPSQRNSHSPDFSDEPLAADINIAFQEAQEKILHLKGLLGNRKQNLVSDIVGGNNHRHAHVVQMSHQYQPAPPNNRPMRRASETGMPWTPHCPHPQHFQQMQQAHLQQITMAKLQAAMERTSSTEKLLQDWDRANGLPASHCQTMVNTSRSRKQLKEGVVLKKWDGSPLLSE